MIQPKFTTAQAQLIVDVLNEAIKTEKEKDQEYALDIQRARDIILAASREK